MADPVPQDVAAKGFEFFWPLRLTLRGRREFPENVGNMSGWESDRYQQATTADRLGEDEVSEDFGVRRAMSVRCRGTPRVQTKLSAGLAPDEHATCFTDAADMPGRRRVVAARAHAKEVEASSAPSRMFTLAMMTELPSYLRYPLLGRDRLAGLARLP